jgi:hypothetical protein
MGQAVPTQHPAVVLRSHFNQLRALLAVALIAVIGLTVAVVILASDDNEISDTNSATPIGRINYGGFNPATGRPESAPLPRQEHPLRSGLESAPLLQRELRMYGFTAQQAAREALPGTRYDGGPEEGINGAAVVPSSPTTRYDGGPEEGTRGVASPPSSSAAADGSAYGQLRRSGALTDGQPTERYDGGPEEGSRGLGR